MYTLIHKIFIFTVNKAKKKVIILYYLKYKKIHFKKIYLPVYSKNKKKTHLVRYYIIRLFNTILYKNDTIPQQ